MDEAVIEYLNGVVSASKKHSDIVPIRLEDLADGVVLARIFDALFPGSVDFKRINQRRRKTKDQINSNFEYLVQCVQSVATPDCTLEVSDLVPNPRFEHALRVFVSLYYLKLLGNPSTTLESFADGWMQRVSSIRLSSAVTLFELVEAFVKMTEDGLPDLDEQVAAQCKEMVGKLKDHLKAGRGSKFGEAADSVVKDFDFALYILGLNTWFVPSLCADESHLDLPVFFYLDLYIFFNPQEKKDSVLRSEWWEEAKAPIAVSEALPADIPEPEESAESEEEEPEEEENKAPAQEKGFDFFTRQNIKNKEIVFDSLFVSGAKKYLKLFEKDYFPVGEMTSNELACKFVDFYDKDPEKETFVLDVFKAILGSIIEKEVSHSVWSLEILRTQSEYKEITNTIRDIETRAGAARSVESRCMTDQATLKTVLLGIGELLQIPQIVSPAYLLQTHRRGTFPRGGIESPDPSVVLVLLIVIKGYLDLAVLREQEIESCEIILQLQELERNMEEYYEKKRKEEEEAAKDLQIVEKVKDGAASVNVILENMMAKKIEISKNKLERMDMMIQDSQRRRTMKAGKETIINAKLKEREEISKQIAKMQELKEKIAKKDESVDIHVVCEELDISKGAVESLIETPQEEKEEPGKSASIEDRADQIVKKEMLKDLFDSTNFKVLEDEKKEIIQMMKDEIQYLKEDNQEIREDIEDFSATLGDLLKHNEELSAKLNNLVDHLNRTVAELEEKYQKEKDRITNEGMEAISKIKKEKGGELNKLIQESESLREELYQKKFNSLCDFHQRAAVHQKNLELVEKLKLREISEYAPYLIRPSKEGFLHILLQGGGAFKKDKWTRKWFFLRNNSIGYCKGPNYVAQPEFLKLLPSTIKIESAGESQEKYKRSFVFKVTAGDGTPIDQEEDIGFQKMTFDSELILAAPSEDEMNEWKTLILQSGQMFEKAKSIQKSVNIDRAKIYAEELEKRPADEIPPIPQEQVIKYENLARNLLVENLLQYIEKEFLKT